jgi:hypothetical protein
MHQTEAAALSRHLPRGSGPGGSEARAGGPWAWQHAGRHPASDNSKCAAVVATRQQAASASHKKTSFTNLKGRAMLSITLVKEHVMLTSFGVRTMTDGREYYVVKDILMSKHQTLGASF